MDRDLQSLYDKALQEAPPSEAKLLKELYDLGHYPVRTSKRSKTDTEKHEDNFAQRISKRWHGFRPESRAYIDAVGAMQHEVQNESPDESHQDAASQVRTGQDAGNPTPQDIEILLDSALEEAPE